MLALKEFTVNDLSRYSGVKPNTVRTTISREQNYIEEIGKQQTGKRGGQHRRWRVKPSKIENVRSKLDGLFGQLKVSPGALPEPESAPEIPLGLLIAEDALLRQYPEAKTTKKKRELLELAEINFDSGRAECENLISGDSYTSNVEAIKAHMQSVKELLETHLQSIEGLLILSQLEYELQDSNGKAKPEIDVQKLHNRLTNLSNELWNLGEGNRTYAFDYMQRTAKSPVINMALGW
jgi:hypothetical protein